MVKDHRTNCESSNPDKVLDGDLDQFMDNFLRWCVLKDDSELRGVLNCSVYETKKSFSTR